MPPALRGRGLLAFAVVSFSAFVVSRPALAVDCNTLPSPVYGSGANAVKPLVSRIGAALSQASPPITLVYQGPGQCVGLNQLFGEVPITGTALYWDAQGEHSCTLPLTGQAI